jgi:hypothetical protein
MINREIRKLLLDNRAYKAEGLSANLRKEEGIRLYYFEKKAGYILAADYDIDISKYLSDEEFAKVREARRITIEKR